MSEHFAIAWAELLILFAQIFIIPLGLNIPANEREEESGSLFFMVSRSMPIGVLSSILSLLSPQGFAAFLMSLPWLLTTFLILIHGLFLLRRQGWGEPWRWPRVMSHLYLPVGALWFSCHRFDAHPLGFDGTIVLLTAAHFHYVGFALPLLASFALRDCPFRNANAAKSLALCVIVAPLLVALGITASQLGLGSFLETIASVVMSLSGASIACLQLRLSLRREYLRAARAAWGFGAGCLLVGMLLALSYGLRSIPLFSWLGFAPLSVPMMIALHGTLNAIGFSFISLLGWKCHSVAAEGFL